MKRLIALILVLVMLFTGCAKNTEDLHDDSSDLTVNTETVDTENSEKESDENDSNTDKPEGTQPEGTQPEGTQPEGTQPEGTQPEGTQPEGTQPEGTQPEGTQPENPEHTHSYEATVTEPTCDAAGYTTYTCSVCDDSYRGDVVSALGHNYTSSVTAPTCVANGYTTYICSVCGDSYKADTVSAIGHKYNSSVKAPTCDAMGYTTYTCSKCGDSYVSDVVSAAGHNYNAVVTAPSGNKNGYTTYTCTSCNDSYVVEDTSHAHSYSAVVKAPTCESKGYTTYTCSSCADSYVSNEVASLGHSYKSVVTAPSCQQGGYTTYTCTLCGSSYVGDEVAATGHSYKSTVTEATCETAGYTTYTCTVCSDSYTGNNVAATGHSYKSVVTEATCETAGYTTYTCTSCSYSYKGNTVSATGHKNQTVSGYAATCNVSGLTDGVVCSVCSVTITAQTSIAPLGHTWKAATTEAPKTCTTCGATEGDKLAAVTAPTLSVTYINVGQGDSILIKVDDCDILIDAGEANKGSTVSSYLSSKGVDDIELMINTHPDSDHCGGLTTVLNDFVVEQVWASPLTKTTNAYKNFAAAVTSEGLKIKNPSVGTVFTYEYLTVTVIYDGSGTSESNDASIVVMVQYGSFKFLMTGDISDTIESKILSSGKDVSCDVLKVSHHGSKYGSSDSFLSAAGADYGVICVGSNSYGHPTSETLTRLSNAGVTVYRTDLNGNVVFSTNGSTLTLPGGSSVSGGSGSSGSSSSGSSSSGSSSSGSSSSTQIFIGNTDSKIFHLPTCSSLPDVSKQNTMYDYWWIINIAGYTPCGRCLKNYTPDSGSVSGTAYIANTESKVYHLFTCSNLPAASKQAIIYSTAGYTPCGRCIKSSSTSYIANTESKVYHLSTCSNLPAASKQMVIYDTTGYTPCGRCIGKSSKNDSANTSAGTYSTYSMLPTTSKRTVITVLPIVFRMDDV